MYQLARHGYNVQLTDSRFPRYDILAVSPSGKHFGIEVKGQSTKSFWRFEEREPNQEMFYAFVYVPPEGMPEVFLMDSAKTMELWKQYKAGCVARGIKEDNIWGLNWKQPHQYKDRYDTLPP